MTIISNIPAAIKLYSAVTSFNTNKTKIGAAKSAGDFEEERKWIMDSASTFGPMLMKNFGCDLHIHG